MRGRREGESASVRRSSPPPSKMTDRTHLSSNASETTNSLERPSGVVTRASIPQYASRARSSLPPKLALICAREMAMPGTVSS